MPGELVDGRVLLRDEKEAATLYNKGAYGTPVSGGGLDLDLVEAAYLAEMNRLDVVVKGWRLEPVELLALAAAAGELFEVRWHVYRDLRGRALVVKPHARADFQIYPRGGLPGKSPATHLVHAVSERDLFHPGRFAEECREAAKFGRRVLAALVDEEGDVTYYEARLEDPRGETPARLAELPGDALLFTDRVLVKDDVLRAELAKEHYGRAVGPALELPLVEAVHLAETAGLRLKDASRGAPASAEEARRRARAGQPDFDLRHATFADLRARGVVAKTGFKYGTHFRVYPKGPDEGHAPFLVHAVVPDQPIPWPDVAGWIRVSHGVRKTLLLAAGADYLRLEWTKP